MGLRLRNGVLLDDFRKETHTPLTQFVDRDRLQKLTDEGLLELTDQHIRASAAGRQKLNAVLSYLISQ